MIALGLFFLALGVECGIKGYGKYILICKLVDKGLNPEEAAEYLKRFNKEYDRDESIGKSKETY